MGSRMLVDALTDGLPEPVEQQGEPTHAAKIDPAELEVDWSRPAADIDRLVRLGGAWTTFRGRRLKVWAAETLPDDDPDLGDAELPGALHGACVRAGEGGLRLVVVQPEGKGRQDAAAWRNGARPEPGERLGT
jgi:methionyl-tRNA formyltransferase